MASVRDSRGRLFIDYRQNGNRQRIFVGLADTPENRAQLQPILKRVDACLRDGGDIRPMLAKMGLLEVDNIAPLFHEPSVQSQLPQRTQVLDQQSPTFAVFAEQWFTEFKVGWRKTYITTVRGILDQHLLPRFGTTQVGRVHRAQILEFRSHLSQQRGRRPGSTLSPARINTIMLILRQILQEAADRYEFTMPMGRLRPLKIPKSDVDPFSLDQVDLIINKVRPDYRHYMIVRFFSGMRSGEIHGLKWKYVDFERRLILVRETIVGGEEEYTKTDSSQRDIQMSQIVYDALKAQDKATGSLKGYVFCNRKGEPLDTNNVTKRVWYPLLRHLGLTARRPYQTRHTAATLWLASGEAPEWIARQLGHASTEMLFRVYSRFVPNMTRRDGSAMDRLLTSHFAPDRGANASDTSSSDAHPPSQAPPRYAMAA